ncbi:PAS domain-containing protein [Candidatus Endomicrobiellum cubanum]|uniref:PAS domain-containing protein n=1 Tax=Candidatus Endomicrobiellum cubanum TaxID=3242325 RepID=UPI0035933CE6
MNIPNNILMYIPGYVYWKDLNGVYLGCNQMEAELAGLKSPEEMIGKADYDFSWKDTASILQKTDKMVIQSRVPEEVIEIPTLSDGRTVVMLTRKSPLYDENNNVVGVIGVSIDITDRKTKEELQNFLKTQTYIDNILQYIPGCVYWKDINGVYLGCNQMEAEILGLNFPKEVVGKTDYDLLLKYAAEVIEKTDKRIMKTEISEEIIETGTFLDGRSVTLLTKKSPLYDENNNVVGIIGTSMDITDRRRAEELQKKVILQEELYNIAKQVSHDIFSPISSLKMVQFMSADKLSEKEKNILDLSIKSIETMSKSLMDKYACMNLKKMEPSQNKEEYIILGLSLDSIVEIKKYEYKINSVEINYYPDKENSSVCVKGDSSGFSRMMSNIINNAIESLEGKDEGRVDIGYILKKDKVEIYVKDNGKGMPKETIEKIINCQEVQTTKKNGHGLGFGQIMQTLKDMNAQILINSKENIGTEIRLILNTIKQKNV